MITHVSNPHQVVCRGALEVICESFQLFDINQTKAQNPASTPSLSPTRVAISEIALYAEASSPRQMHPCLRLG